ncbi:MAG: cysteine hydrolase family protein [Planctomycetota bacterium]
MTMEQILKARQERIDALHEIQRDRTALLVIDMQRGFLEPGAALEVPPGRELISCIKQLIECCRDISVPVIFTEFVYSSALPCLRGDPFGPQHLPSEPDKPTGFGYQSSNCLLDQKGVNSPDTIPELAPAKDELVVRAHAYDKFYDTNLDYALRSRDIRYLIITGIMADICVNCTLLSASTREYRVTAVTDAIATLWPNILDACFDIWKRKFARLRTTDEMIAELREA